MSHREKSHQFLTLTVYRFPLQYQAEHTRQQQQPTTRVIPKYINDRPDYLSTHTPKHTQIHFSYIC